MRLKLIKMTLLVIREHERRVERLENGEITSGTGKNQETSLHRPGDTRWGHTMSPLFAS